MTTPTATPHSLHLDERQRAMLQAMGVIHWWPTEAQADSQAAAAEAAAVPPAAGADAGEYVPGLLGHRGRHHAAELVHHGALGQ